MPIEVIEETCEIGEAKISVAVLSLRNAEIVLVTDRRNEYRIGAMALATPVGVRIGESPPSVVALLGARADLLAKVLAGKASAVTGKISLSIVGLGDQDSSIISRVVETARKMLARKAAQGNNVPRRGDPISSLERGD